MYDTDFTWRDLKVADMYDTDFIWRDLKLKLGTFSIVTD